MNMKEFLEWDKINISLFEEITDCGMLSWLLYGLAETAVDAVENNNELKKVWQDLRKGKPEYVCFDDFRMFYKYVFDNNALATDIRYDFHIQLIDNYMEMIINYKEGDKI